MERLTNLEKLELKRTPVTDADLAQLARLSQLTSLSFNHAQVTDEGLFHLKGLTEFRELHLGVTKVTQKGITKLKTVFPNCRMDGVGLRNGESGAIYALMVDIKLHDRFNWTARSGPIRTLSLTGATVTNAGLEHLEDLNLSQTKVTDAGLEHLKALTSLQRLDLHGTTQISDAAWSTSNG